MPLVTRQVNQGRLFVETTEPSNTWLDGDLWSDTTANILKLNVSGTATDVGVSSFSSSATVTFSTTIGDYVQPDAAIATSTTTADRVVDDDFTSYADQSAFDAVYPVTQSGGGGNRVLGNPTNDNIVADVVGADSADNVSALTRDITSISDTAWVMRFKLVIISNSSADVNFNEISIGLSNNTDFSSIAQDFIGFTLSRGTSTTAQLKIVDTDNAVVFGASDQTFAHVLTNETLFVEIIRLTSTTYSVELFSNSAFTASIEKENGTCAATLDTLRFFKAVSKDNSGAGGITSTIDASLEIWDGITFVPGADRAVDDNTTTFWESAAETNPAIFVDEGELNNFVGVALFWNALTTETEITIRVSTDNTFTSAEDVRTITTSNLTDGAFNFIRFNVTIGRFLQIRGSSGSSLVLAINEIKDLVKTDSEILADLGILAISPTDTSLALDGT